MCINCVLTEQMHASNFAAAAAAVTTVDKSLSGGGGTSTPAKSPPSPSSGKDALVFGITQRRVSRPTSVFFCIFFVEIYTNPASITEREKYSIGRSRPLSLRSPNNLQLKNDRWRCILQQENSGAKTKNNTYPKEPPTSSRTPLPLQTPWLPQPPETSRT